MTNDSPDMQVPLLVGSPATTAALARAIARLLAGYADALDKAAPQAVAAPAPQIAWPAQQPVAAPAKPAAPAPNAATASAGAEPVCPKCAGPLWDNRDSKKNPKAPDFKCKDRACDGVIWPPRDAKPAARTTTVPMPVTGNADWAPVNDDELPF